MVLGGLRHWGFGLRHGQLGAWILYSHSFYLLGFHFIDIVLSKKFELGWIHVGLLSLERQTFVIRKVLFSLVFIWLMMQSAMVCLWVLNMSHLYSNISFTFGMFFIFVHLCCFVSVGANEISQQTVAGLC